MRGLKYILLMAVVMTGLLPGMAQAGEVRVFMPMEEGVSPMELRKRALAEGFALAVVEESKAMLPGDMDETRTELFKEYLQINAKPYIQGYKIISSQAMEEGIILDLDVQVNKRTLRDGLKSMGMFTTVIEQQVASISWPDDFGEESLAQLQGLLTLTGIVNNVDVLPAFAFESGPENAFKGRLKLDRQEWVLINKDMTKVWFGLWEKYFNRSDNRQTLASKQKLAIAGWFSPDAALEFDRVLQGWDSSVQDVQLVELDMQPTGVGGTWEFRLLNGQRLGMLLESYLPQRGLTYQLSEESD